LVAYIPKRGDFIWIDFDPQAGHEQMGSRPALVVNRDGFNEKLSFVFVCPIGNTQRKNPFYVLVPEGEAVRGAVMCNQMRSLDFRARKASFKGECPDLLLQNVLRRIKPILF
jgi:mRNA interferase MazF